MIKFKYRWIYGLSIFLLISLIGFFYTIKPELDELEALQLTKTDLQQEVINTKNNSAQSFTEIMPILSQQTIQMKYLSDIAMLVHKSGSILQSINFLVSSEKYAIAQLSLQGNYHQLLSFILSLPKHSYLLAMLDFTFELIASNRYQLKMNLFLAGNNKNIFSHDYKKNELTQLKMVGYLEEGKNSQALVTLPNNFFATIKMGDVIGSEQALVINILPNYLEVKLPNGTHQVFHLRKNK